MQRVFVIFRSNLLLDEYPAIQSILRVLVDIGYSVSYIGGYVNDGIKKDFELVGVNFYHLSVEPAGKNLKKIVYFIKTKRQVLNYLEKLKIGRSDILLISERRPSYYMNLYQFGSLAEMYNVVFRFSENLSTKNPLWFRILCAGIDISKILNSCSGIISCEYNRAHILKGIFGINKLPYILPNKPYVDDTLFDNIPKEIDVELRNISMKIASKKVILYQGVYGRERRLDEFCEAINELSDDYVLMIMSKPNSSLDELQKKYESKKIIFVPFVRPPYHLCFTKLARIGILTYVPNSNNASQVLNVLYCAPNKIFEYGKYAVPMIANDLPSLRRVFDTYDAGISINYPYDRNEIKKAILTIDSNYDIYSQGSKSYYDSVDVVDIIKKIFTQ